jgi:phosphopantetheine adenylyltransferase
MNLDDAEVKAKRRAYRAEQKAMKLATGKTVPKELRPKSVVNNVTEYGALFNRLNEERVAKGQKPLKTAMEVLIEAMQSDEMDIQAKARIADKLAPFESSRAPVISIEHVQNMKKDEEVDANEALDDFLNALKKV